MLPPAAAVAGGVMMLVLATRAPTALVVDDYARIEDLTQIRFDRDRQAAVLGLVARLQFSAAPSRIDVTLTGQTGFDTPRWLLLSLQHATDPEADLEIELSRTDNLFGAALEFRPGRYRLELMPPDRSWRLGGSMRPADRQVRLQPQNVASKIPGTEAWGR